jgi:hypothetical protein
MDEIAAVRRAAIAEGLHFALFRITAIAELAGPAKAVDWGQSVLDDDELRAAFVAGVSGELAARARAGTKRVGAGQRFRLARVSRRQTPDPPLVRLGHTR